MGEVILEIKNLFTSYGRIPMLMDISLTVHQQNICCLLGPNGAGKTTLINAIIGTVNADKGQIIFKGEDITNLPTRQDCKGIQVASAGVGTFPK